jgi:hypothetical protein
LKDREGGRKERRKEGKGEGRKERGKEGVKATKTYMDKYLKVTWFERSHFFKNIEGTKVT